MADKNGAPRGNPGQRDERRRRAGGTARPLEKAAEPATARAVEALDSSETPSNGSGSVHSIGSGEIQAIEDDDAQSEENLKTRLSDQPRSSASQEDLQVDPAEPFSEDDANTRLSEHPDHPERPERPAGPESPERPDGEPPPLPRRKSEELDPDDREQNTRPARPSARTPSVPPPRDKRIGQVLSGRYRIERLIGKGGMGRVYLATQFPLNRSVAIKILNPEFQRKDPQFVRRFFLEASTAARLTHPNTITVFDYGESDSNELYIAMEYLKGRPLSRALSTDGAFSAERTMHVAMQIVRALREAHAKGIIHRDLKPGNIMLLEEGDDADYAKVLDFGLVKLFNVPGAEMEMTPVPADQVGELTRAGMFLGSPKYMSPEQIQGADLDPRTDIYSLGVIMYHMLTGKPPFRGSTSVEIIYKHVNESVPPLHETNPEADAPPELERVVLKCLSKRRTERYASMGELLVALKDVRRMLTGVSSASGSGIEFLGRRDLTDPSLAPMHPGLINSQPPLVIDPNRVASSIVPNHPAIPVSSRPGPAGPPGDVAAAVSGSAVSPFADPALVPSDPSPSAGSIERSVALDARPKGPQSGLLRSAPYLFGASLVLVLGLLAYQYSSTSTEVPRMAAAQPPPIPPMEAPSVVPPPAPAPAPDPLETRIALESHPPGAAVTENGTLLGQTPFEHVVKRGEGYPAARTFIFTKDGFIEEAIVEKIDSDTLKIRASLRPKPVAEPPDRPKRRPPPAKRPPAPNEEDYKENPY